jgi:hypothetical protein
VLHELLIEAGFFRCEGTAFSPKSRYRGPDVRDGSVLVKIEDRFSLVSLSGGAVSRLYDHQLIMQLAGLLCVLPGLRVTRLDLCLDVDYES